MLIQNLAVASHRIWAESPQTKWIINMGHLSSSSSPFPSPSPSHLKWGVGKEGVQGVPQKKLHGISLVLGLGSRYRVDLLFWDNLYVLLVNWQFRAEQHQSLVSYTTDPGKKGCVM